ncbi:hypothetical protein GmHk_10G028900 [Glycine max]|nr:hypothetical protein GmHk_10G028900 [Glycine max]
MARTKKTGQMTSEVAKRIADKIDSLEEQASQGCTDCCHWRPEHPSRVHVVGAGVTIKKYFGPAPRTSHTSSSMAPEDQEQLTQQIRDQLEESITENVTQQMMLSFSHMQFQFQSQMQSQGLGLPPEPKVGPSPARVNIKESCVNPSGNDPDTGDSDKCRLYIKENPPRLVALGRVYEGSTTVGVEEVKDAEAPVPIPTNEVILVGQTINTFLAWPTHLVKRLSEQAVVSLVKPPDRPDHEVDDPLYLMTLIIPQLFLKPITRWSMSQHLYYTVLDSLHEELDAEFITGCLPRSLPEWENLVVWFCSLHNRLDNYLKGIIYSALKELDDTPQPKSKAGARWIVVKVRDLNNASTYIYFMPVYTNLQKGSTECGYYVMHWMSTIILESFKNNWETTIGIRPIEGASHPMGKVLFQS